MGSFPLDLLEEGLKMNARLALLLLVLNGSLKTSAGESHCVTVDGHECKFPFTYDGHNYTECAPSGTIGALNWCANKTDANGNYIDGKWGRCNAGVVCGMTSSAEVTSAAHPSVSTISYDGLWGEWGNTEYCGGRANNGFAVGFKTRVESQQGDGDDTALNSICLMCSGGKTICSKTGFWGNWYESGSCSGGFTGFNMRFQAYCGGDCDDTAANDLQLKCDGSWMGIASPTSWGTWNEKHCPNDQVICGLRTRIERSRGTRGDDSALNGVEFSCCPTEFTVCPDGYKNVVGRNTRTSIETKLNVKTLDDCGDLCDFNEKCTSFMWSPSTEKCMVYDGEEQDESARRDDFRVCKMEFTEVKEKTVEDLLKNSASSAQRIAGIIGGIGEIMKLLFTPDNEKPLNIDTYLKLMQTKSTDGLVTATNRRKAFAMGTNFRKVKIAKGKAYFKEKKMSIKGFQKKLSKLGGALSSVLTMVSPIFLVGELIWGNTEDQNHIAVMGKMDELDKKIGQVVEKMRAQTHAIDYFIKHESYVELAQSLEDIGDAHQKWLEKDGSAEFLLKQSYSKFSSNVNLLAARIGPYFQTTLQNDWGKCDDLADIRLWLDMTLLKASLGAYMGCRLATLKEEGEFNKDTDCLMKTEQENILTIQTIMTKILSKCNRDHVIMWTKKYIKEKLTSGTGEEKKNKLKAYLDKTFPNFYYLIAVQGEDFGFKAWGDIYEKSDKHNILVNIATKKSTCQSSSLSTTVLGADFGEEACNNLHNLSPIYNKFNSYWSSHDVSSYAVYVEGSYAYKGIRPCVGSVTCTRQVRCVQGRRIMMRYFGGGIFGKAIADLLRECPQTRRAHYIAANQWKCNIVRNGAQMEKKNCKIQN